MEAIQRGRAVDGSLEDLYRQVENLCSLGLSEKLYGRLEGKLRAHVERVFGELEEYSRSSDDERFLAELERCWQEHCRQMKTVRNVFLYLDRTFVVATPRLRSLWDVGLALFRQAYAERRPLVERTVAATLDLVAAERRRQGAGTGTGDDSVDEDATKTQQRVGNVTQMFCALQLYDGDFEPRFLDSTRAFYSEYSRARLGGGDVRGYLFDVSQRLQWESARAGVYLSSSTRARLTQALEDELLAKHAGQILERGFGGLMDDGDVAALRLLHQLFACIHGVAAIRHHFKEYIKRAGGGMVNDPGHDGKMVESLLAFKDRLNRVVDEAFGGCSEFQSGVKDSFEHFLNVRKDKPAELVAKYLDGLLSGSRQQDVDAAFEAQLNKVMVLFRFISSHDVFESFYKNDLARRLLGSRPVNSAAEKLMINKLKTECGASFTSKLEGMFKDIDQSQALMVGFRSNSLASIDNPALLGSASVYVLTQGNWPVCPKLSLRLPPLLEAVQRSFSDYYLGHHESRQLSWQHSLSHCLVTAAFPNGRKELAVSLSQAVVLLLFTSLGVALDLPALQQRTELEPVELKNALLSLATGKQTLLLKSSPGRDILPTDEFRINPDFAHPAARIKIGVVQTQEVERAEEARSEVFKDRQHQVDAAIVRIMKAKKTLDQAQLLSELQKELKFPLEVHDANLRIETLVDRDFLERDPSNSQLLSYVV